jgi:AraC-like DNA-binding protein
MPNDEASGSIALSSGMRTIHTQSDLLSQLLMLIRLQGEVIYSSDLSGPWAFSFPAGPAHFHYVLEGPLHVTEAGGGAVVAAEGDLVLLPFGNGHRIAGGPDAGPPEADPLLQGLETGGLLLKRSGEGRSTRLVSGTFRFDGHVSPSVLGRLPAVIRISKAEGGNAEWLEALVHFLLAEARLPAPGSAIMISRLIDVLVVRTIRSWADLKAGELTGWLGGLGDRGIERALEALHREPARDWTVAELAQHAAMSRTIFAERFVARVGEPPLRYLKGLRLSLASDLLGAGSDTVGEIGRRIGYRSEAAFSRAYRDHFGHPPGADLPNAPKV